MSDEKIVIYQVLPRLFSNMCDTCVPNGAYVQNGAGKLNHFTFESLTRDKKVGCELYLVYGGYRARYQDRLFEIWDSKG